MPDTVTITDNRTGKQYELPIEDGTIKGITVVDDVAHAATSACELPRRNSAIVL